MSGSQRAPPLHSATSLGRRRQWWLWGEQNSNYSSVAHSPSSTLIQSQDGGGGGGGGDAREGEKEEGERGGRCKEATRTNGEKKTCAD